MASKQNIPFNPIFRAHPHNVFYFCQSPFHFFVCLFGCPSPPPIVHPFLCSFPSVARIAQSSSPLKLSSPQNSLARRSICLHPKIFLGGRLFASNRPLSSPSSLSQFRPLSARPISQVHLSLLFHFFLIIFHWLCGRGHR